ncbi:MAG: hypothetical protein WBE20_08305 [Candidatus Acidiferrales bacterium]
MGKNTPHLIQADKKDYLEKHLFVELQWVLYAATEWSIQNRLQLQKDGYMVQNYAMDSAFLHARTLFEFFVKQTNDNHYGVEEFLPAKLTSKSYDDWEGPLHSFLMHAQDRSKPGPLTTSSGQQKNLIQMPVEFANEILRLWQELEKQLGASSNQTDHQLRDLARSKREEAIENAKCVVNSCVAQQHSKEKGQMLTPIF